jgi:hypothetical protein
MRGASAGRKKRRSGTLRRSGPRTNVAKTGATQAANNCAKYKYLGAKRNEVDHPGERALGRGVADVSQKKKSPRCRPQIAYE